MSFVSTVSLCRCVCMPLNISQEPQIRTFLRCLCIMPGVVARSSPGVVAIHSVLPVLWMTSCFHMMDPITWVIHVGRKLKMTHQGAAPNRGGVRCLQIPFFRSLLSCMVHKAAAVMRTVWCIVARFCRFCRPFWWYGRAIGPMYLYLHLHNMLCEYLHTKSESLAEIRTTNAEIQHFSRALFLLAHHICYTSMFATNTVTN